MTATESADNWVTVEGGGGWRGEGAVRVSMNEPWIISWLEQRRL